MNVAGLRDGLGLTQTQFAALLGVSQAAVSQYESGRREPVGEVLGFYRRLQVAVDAPVVAEWVGRRPTTMPTDRWERVIDSARVGLIELPVRLDWSPRRTQGWNTADVEHRRELYRLLIDVGEAVDVMTYVDVDELVAWSDDLPVSRDARGVLDRLVERVALTAGV